MRRDALETIEAIRELKRRYPDVQTTLGVSNVSFGLNAAARQVLNSVFLHECVNAGLDTAIVCAAKILPMAKIDDEQRSVALDLVYDRRRSGPDGTTTRSTGSWSCSRASRRPRRGRAGPRSWPGCRCSSGWSGASSTASGPGLEADLDEALDSRPALEIINDTLLSGMKTVGELFGSGQMQLPFVLASAEVMKTAVAHLEPHMERTDSDGKGTIVLATVKGDVHDIGKNLVDIILTNNGYTVVNLGIKQPISTILGAAEEHRADAVGMSGLLVKSTVIMKENLQEMNSRGIARTLPVLLGGAALTRSYVENDLSEVYEGRVAYARDAFEGLRLMDATMARARGDLPEVDPAEAAAKAERKARHERSQRVAAKRRAAEADDAGPIPERSDVAVDNPLPTPPFWGTRVVRGVALAEYAGMVDERALFLGQWGLRGARSGSGPTYEELVETEGRPRLRYWLDRLSTEGVLAHAAVVYGYFPAVSEGDSLVVLAQDDGPIRGRTPPSGSASGSRASAATATCAWPTSGARARSPSSAARSTCCRCTWSRWASRSPTTRTSCSPRTPTGTTWRCTAWACSSPRRSRSTGTGGSGRSCGSPTGTASSREDPDDVEEFFKLGYRGARYSLGYGACPNLDDRTKIVELLQPGRIGVELSEELQLHPEQSTDAMVAHHPEAKYFNAG